MQGLQFVDVHEVVESGPVTGPLCPSCNITYLQAPKPELFLYPLIVFIDGILLLMTASSCVSGEPGVFTLRRLRFPPIPLLLDGPPFFDDGVGYCWSPSGYTSAIRQNRATG